MDGTNSESRRWSRYPADWAARVTTSSGASFEVRVVDSGHGGLGLKSCPQFELGESVEVTLVDVGKFPCRVVWQEDDRCGVEFVELIELADDYWKLFLGGPFAGHPGFDAMPTRNYPPARQSDGFNATFLEAIRSKSSCQASVQHETSQADVDSLSRKLENLSRDLKCCQELVAKIAGTLLEQSRRGRLTRGS